MIRYDKEFELNSDYRKGIASTFIFSEIFNFLKNNKNMNVLINLANYKYIHPSFAVLIAASPYIAKNTGNNLTIRYSKDNKKCIDFLKRSGILKHYNCLDTKKEELKGTVAFNVLNHHNEFDECIKKLIKNIPANISAELKDIIYSKIYEIFDNSLTHSETDQVFFCGSLDTQSSLIFCIYDMGIGIPKKVMNYMQKNISPKDALKWAWEKGNSTLNKELDYPRGAGLHLMEDFVKENNGDIFMISDNSYCKITQKSNRFYNNNFSILGTFFCLTIKKDSKHKYEVHDETIYSNEI